MVEQRRNEILCAAFNTSVRKHFHYSCPCDLCSETRDYLIALKAERMSFRSYDGSSDFHTADIGAFYRYHNRAEKARMIGLKRKKMREGSMLTPTRWDE